MHRFHQTDTPRTALQQQHPPTHSLDNNTTGKKSLPLQPALAVTLLPIPFQLQLYPHLTAPAIQPPPCSRLTSPSSTTKMPPCNTDPCPHPSPSLTIILTTTTTPLKKRITTICSCSMVKQILSRIECQAQMITTPSSTSSFGNNSKTFALPPTSPSHCTASLTYGGLLSGANKGAGQPSSGPLTAKLIRTSPSPTISQSSSPLSIILASELKRLFLPSVSPTVFEPVTV